MLRISEPCNQASKVGKPNENTGRGHARGQELWKLQEFPYRGLGSGKECIISISNGLYGTHLVEFELCCPSRPTLKSFKILVSNILTLAATNIKTLEATSV